MVSNVQQVASDLWDDANELLNEYAKVAHEMAQELCEDAALVESGCMPRTLAGGALAVTHHTPQRLAQLYHEAQQKISAAKRLRYVLAEEGEV